MFTIAVDVYGGDLGPRVAFQACRDVLRCRSDVQLWLPILEGDVEQASNILSDVMHRVTVVGCTQVITPNLSLSQLLRESQDSSMARVLTAHKDSSVDGVLSIGSTGALMVLSKRLIGTLPDLQRPALSKQIPTRKNPVLMLDLGANLTPNQDLLITWSILALAWNRARGHNHPKISLLNIGAEDIKGPAFVRDAASVLEIIMPDEFIGYSEGYDLFHGVADVIVCDGFTGNVALKTMEGFSGWLNEKAENPAGIPAWLRWATFAFRRMMKSQLSHLAPNMQGGAILLGLNGLVVKTHGNSNRTAFKQALLYLIDQANDVDIDVVGAEYSRLLQQASGTLNF